MDDDFSGVATLTVDDGGEGIDSDTATVIFNNVPPSVDVSQDVAIALGNTFTGAGSFTDPGNDTWTATIDYGDPGANTLLTRPAGETRVVVWDTLADLDVITDATPRIRLRATDSLDGAESFLSPWTTQCTPPVSNP